MNFRPVHVVAGVLGFLLVIGVNFDRGQEQAAAPFSPGETLTYDVDWSIFPAGRVSAMLMNGSKDALDAYEVKTTAHSQGFVSLLYPVANEFHSFFDPRTLCSQRITKTTNEGRRRKQTEIIFNTERKLAILEERDLAKANSPPKHDENSIPPCVEDVVTAFYYLRRQPFHVGQPIQLPVNDGAKTFEVTVEVQSREQIKTPMGIREAFRVEPKVFGGLYKRKGRMLIWFSDDEQRLPLRIKATISVGTITGTLRSVSNSPAVAPSAKP